jgi:hypothetical protein
LSIHHCKRSSFPLRRAHFIVSESHGHPLFLHHFNMSKCPLSAAFAQVVSVSSHGNPFPRHHFSTSKFPPIAAKSQVSLSHGHQLSQHHLTKFKCPPIAANKPVHSSHGHPLTRHHFNSSKCPPCAAYSQVRLYTTGFFGHFNHDKPLPKNHAAYLLQFSKVPHLCRNTDDLLDKDHPYGLHNGILWSFQPG